MMFTWLKRWLAPWAERYLERENQRRYEEGFRLKAELLRLTGDKRVVLSPEDRQRLWERAQRIAGGPETSLTIRS